MSKKRKYPIQTEADIVAQFRTLAHPFVLIVDGGIFYEKNIDKYMVFHELTVDDPNYDCVAFTREGIGLVVYCATTQSVVNLQSVVNELGFESHVVD